MCSIICLRVSGTRVRFTLYTSLSERLTMEQDSWYILSSIRKKVYRSVFLRKAKTECKTISVFKTNFDPYLWYGAVFSRDPLHFP